MKIIGLSFVINLFSIIAILSNASDRFFFQTAASFFSTFFASLIFSLPFLLVPLLIYTAIGFTMMRKKKSPIGVAIAVAICLVLLLFDLLFLNHAFTSTTRVAATVVIKNRLITFTLFVLIMVVLQYENQHSEE